MVKKIGQRRFLLKNGYTDEQLNHMTPHEAHTIISEIEKSNREKRAVKAKKEKAIIDIIEKIERENHIKEMASDMDYGCTKHDIWPDDAKEIAKALIILGYQKVKPNEMVVMRDEYQNTLKDYTVLINKFDTLSENYKLCKDANETLKQNIIKYSNKIVEDVFEKINENMCLFELDITTDKHYRDGYICAISDICGRLDETKKYFFEEYLKTLFK